MRRGWKECCCLLPPSSSSTLSPLQMLPACWISLARSHFPANTYSLAACPAARARQPAQVSRADNRCHLTAAAAAWNGLEPETDGVAWMEAASIPSFLPRQRRNSRLCWHCTGRRHVFRAKPRFYTAQLGYALFVRLRCPPPSSVNESVFNLRSSDSVSSLICRPPWPYLFFWERRAGMCRECCRAGFPLCKVQIGGQSSTLVSTNRYICTRPGGTHRLSNVITDIKAMNQMLSNSSHHNREEFYITFWH